MKLFVTSIVDAFNVDSGAVQVATVKYSSYKKITLVHHLNKYKTAASVKKAIMGMKCKGGATATGKYERVKCEFWQKGHSTRNRQGQILKGVPAE